MNIYLLTACIVICFNPYHPVLVIMTNCNDLSEPRLFFVKVVFLTWLAFRMCRPWSFTEAGLYLMTDFSLFIIFSVLSFNVVACFSICCKALAMQGVVGKCFINKDWIDFQ